MQGFAIAARLDDAPAERRSFARIATAVAGVAEPRLTELPGGAWAAAAPGSLASSPLPGDGDEAWLLFHGRLDNRDELRGRHGPSSGPASDAEIALAVYAAKGESAFDLLVGPWSILLAHTRPFRLLLARDALGGRPLYLRRNGPELFAASRPAALLAGDGAEPDESTIARYLAVRGPRPGATFFRDVEELPPGALLRVSAAGSERTDVARLTPATGLPRRENELEEAFRERLDLAVGCRLPERGGVAVLMSGGLDSTAVAATAARSLAATSAPAPLAVSWIFEALPGADERRWIDATVRHAGLRARAIVGDRLGPLAEEDQWPSRVDAPWLEPYWLLRRRALDAAREAGATVMLTGESGDQLWEGSAYWLRDLAAAGRLLATAAGALRASGSALRGRHGSPTLREAAGRLVHPLPARPARELPRPWMTPLGSSLAEAERVERPADALRGAALECREAMTGSLDRGARLAAAEDAIGAGVELRHPFRDRRLVEWFLALLPRWLHRPGESKRLLRRALADRLPEIVLARRQATSLLPLFDVALGRDALETVLETLLDREAIWPRYVRREWLLDHALPTLGSPRDGIERLVLWHCLCLERWRRAVSASIAKSSIHS